MIYTLECGHCGGAAVSEQRDLFHEGMADRCEECGYPGQVIVDDIGDGDGDEETGEPTGVAHWSTSERPGVRCRRPNCDDGCEDDA